MSQEEQKLQTESNPRLFIRIKPGTLELYGVSATHCASPINVDLYFIKMKTSA